MDRARLAGAPISWGVCEVPGWGHQMPADRVLAEMAGLGLAATEFGPDGFLPDDPARRAAVLAGHHLRPVGGFVPARLHVAGHDPVPELRQVFAVFAATGAGTVVLAADTGLTGYDRRPDLDAEGWSRLLGNLDRVGAAAAERGLTACLHPHVGTLVESGEEVDRVLQGSTVPLCLDTGHLLIGGSDPAELARAAPTRVAHVHLKDVHAGLAARVGAGELTYTEAVARGIYRPLGRGDVDVAGVVGALEGGGYRGWYVMEQDTVLTAEPAPGAGPVADVRAGLAYLTDLAA